MPRKGLYKEGAFVAAYAMISKGLGVVREIAMAYFFGTSGAVDAYRISITAVLLPVDTLAGSTLGNSFIPTFKQMISGGKTRLGWLLANQILILLLVGGALCTLLVMAFSGSIVRIIAPGFDPTRMKEATLLTATLAPMLPFLAGACLIGFVLNSLYMFRTAALQPVIQNLGLLVGIVIAASIGSLVPLSLGTVGAYILFIGILAWVVKKHWVIVGWHPRRRDRKVWGYFLQAFTPLFILSLIQHGNILVDRMVSSLLAVGSVASLEYARFIVETPTVTLGLGMARVALPHFSDLETQGKREEVISTLERLLYGSLLWLLPLSLFLGMASHSIIGVVYGYGRFGADSVLPTARALNGFSVGMWAAFGCYLMQRVYNAQRRNGILTILCTIGLAVNTILNIELGPRIGVQGIAVATSIANILLFSLMLLGISWRSFQRMVVHGGYLVGGVIIIRYLLDYLVPWNAKDLLVVGVVAGIIMLAWIPWVMAHPMARQTVLSFYRRHRR
jgi:putative peptidoglycan lipid II flippase